MHSTIEIYRRIGMFCEVKFLRFPTCRNYAILIFAISNECYYFTEVINICLRILILRFLLKIENRKTKNTAKHTNPTVFKI